MCTGPVHEKNFYLDQVLAERRSYRQFRQEFPEREAIERIIYAGLLAPYAALAVGGSGDYFRRFFVIGNGSEAMKKTAPLVLEEVGHMIQGLEKEVQNNTNLKAKVNPFFMRLSTIRKTGIVPGIGTAPYYVIVAEKKGFPPVELQSLAHCMENMWLKATALCLGFQIVSVTQQMANNAPFCSLLGIEPGGWELMGCAIGYPLEELPPSIRPPVENVTSWLP